LSITWRAATAGLETATAVCAALNLAYFLGRCVSAGSQPLPRRVAAFVLAVLSLGALLESGFVLASVVSLSGEDSVFASAEWTAVRGITFAGTVCVSALVLRAVGNGK